MKYKNAAVLSRTAYIQAQRQALAQRLVRFSSIEDVARHEASHAVVARAMFGSVSRMKLARRGVEWTGWTAYPPVPPHWRVEVAPGVAGHAPPSAFAMGLVTIAGPIGERTAADGSFIRTGIWAVDEAEMQMGEHLLCSALGATILPGPDAGDMDQIHVGQMNALMARVPHILVQLLTQYGSARDALAARLLVRRRLGVHELKPMLAGIPQIGPNAIFDQLRAGTAVGPLPEMLPPAFLEAALKGARTGCLS